MFIIKIIILVLILITSVLIGILFSKKYTCRVNELRNVKNGLNMFATKVKFTYQTVPAAFLEVSEKIGGNIGNIFQTASEKMQEKSAEEAWYESLDNSQTNMNKLDIQIIKGLGKMLGATDVEGQLNEIKLVNEFLDKQLEDAEYEKSKNEKMYRTLGIITGLTITILLI